ncbi:MAG: periplasmic heavy metal sensor [Nitrospinota bacterium]|nr:MAG: periplasmic heavy metal sensor [Nitrospinota bacterium]
MNTKRRIITGIMVAALLLTALVWGGWRQGSQTRGLHSMVEQVAATLQLDDTQRATLEEIMFRLEQERQALCSDREDSRGMVREQLGRETLDTAVIQAAFRAEQAKLDRGVEVFLDSLEAFHALLTPEQRRRLVGLWETHEDGGYRHRYRHADLERACTH